MNLFLPLLLTHFIADYPLQSGWLIQLKKRGYLGVLLHCLIHLSVMCAVLFPLLGLKEVWFGIGVIFVTHNIIDYIKVNLDKRHPEWGLFLYITDQILHILVVSIVIFYFKRMLPESLIPTIYSNKALFMYGLTLVWSTYFLDITRYFVKHPKEKTPYKRDYKMMAVNAFIVTIAFGAYWLAN